MSMVGPRKSSWASTTRSTAIAADDHSPASSAMSGPAPLSAGPHRHAEIRVKSFAFVAGDGRRGVRV